MKSMLAALLLVLVLAGSAAAEDAVVIEGGSLQSGLLRGSVFSADAVITLASGERLKVLLQSGDMVERAGPWRGSFSASGEGGPSDGALRKVSALVLGRGGTRGVLGASREFTLLGDPPDVWLISVEAPGVRCVDGAPRLWRRDVSSGVSVTVASERTRVGPLTWPAGQAALTLPPALASASALEVTMSGTTRRFELRPVPRGRDLATPGALLIWFAEAGCERQAARLLERLLAR